MAKPLSPDKSLPAQPASVTLDSAQRLLETAERLFATEGIDAVPLSVIVVTAGYRNPSALHYHFGGRSAVVAHVLNMRLAHMNALRNAQLDRLVNAGDVGDVRAVYQAIVQPLMQGILKTSWGVHYVQVLAQVVQSPRSVQSELIDRTQLSGLLRVRTLLQPALAHVPPTVLDQRLVWANDNVVLALARWSRLAPRPQTPRATLEGILDYCVAGLSAQAPRTRARQRPTNSADGGIGFFFG